LIGNCVIRISIHRNPYRQIVLVKSRVISFMDFENRFVEMVVN